MQGNKGILIATMIILLCVIPQIWAQMGAVLKLDGNNDYATRTTTANLNNTTYTISAWINATQFGDSLKIFALDNHAPGYGFSFGLMNTGEIRIGGYIGGGSLKWLDTSGANIGLGTWYHVAVVVDGVSIVVYVDGVSRMNEVFGNIRYSTSSPIVAVGSGYDTNLGGYHRFWPGQIDEMRIWNVARTQQQIQNDMNQPLPNPASQPGLVAYWQFDELKDLGINNDGADDVEDLSGNGNHLDLVGDAILETVSLPALTLTGDVGQATLSIDGSLELKGMEVSVTYDDSVVNYSNYSGLHADFNVVSVTDNPGTVIVDGFFDPVPSADYNILTLNFSPVGAGTAGIAISASDLRKQVGNDQVKYVLDTDYTHSVAGDVTFESGPPTVGSVSITNDSVVATDDYVRDTQTVTVTANGTDTPNDSTAVGVDSSGVTADLSDLGGSATAAPSTFNYNSATRQWTATWEVASVTCTPSNGTLTVTVSATDKVGNGPTTGSDTITADNTPPTVSNVACVKSLPAYPASLDAEYVKNGDTVNISADVTDTGSGASSSTADVSQLGGSNALASTGGTSTAPTWSFTVSNSTTEEAQKTVSVIATDVVGNASSAVTDTIHLDNVFPTSVDGFRAYPSNAVDNIAPADRVKLSWTTGGTDTNLAGHVIRRVGWGGSGYPEYPSGSAPSYPGASEGDLVVDGSPTSPYKDTANSGLASSSRNVFYYQIFAYDKAGNFSSAVESQQARSTNYHLGDFHDEGSGTFDGSVDGDDLVDFSNTFGTVSGGAGWDAECDIGPTDTTSRHGVPVPDDAIDFEDLMIFAMNFNNPLAAPPYEPLQVPVGMPLVVLEREDSQPIGTVGTFRVALRLNPELRVKGAHVVLHFDQRFFTPVRVQQGQVGLAFFHAAENPNNLDISVAALGTNQALSGDTLAVVEFAVRGSSPNAALFVSSIDVRGVQNERAELDRLGDVSLKLSVSKPTETQLLANYPNPFNPETWIPYQLASSGDVVVRIYDLTGRLVRELDLGYRPAGYYLHRDSAAYWDGRNNTGERVASGTYIVKFQRGEFHAVRRVVVRK